MTVDGNLMTFLPAISCHSQVIQSPFSSCSRDRRNAHSTWERLGVKGPKATSLLLGNSKEFFENPYSTLPKWTKQYGKVFGFYQMGSPALVVADPDMAKEILIKQFNKFDHRIIMVDNSDDPKAAMFETKGERWKRVRGISSPTFSSKKMKVMSPLVHRSITKLMDTFERRVKNDEQFDISAEWKKLTLDVIASTVFSYDTDVFNSTDNIFLQKLAELFKVFKPDELPVHTQIWKFCLMQSPTLLKVAKFFNPRAAGPPDEWFMALAHRVITERQSSGEVRNDYIQLMLNANRAKTGNASGSETDSELSDNEYARELRGNAKSKFMTMDDMEAQTTLFLAAGYETTATTLAVISHYLMEYPDVQKKLQQEIDEYFPVPGQNINYETVQKLPYLDMVFCEVSRLAAIGQLAVMRVCNETTEIQGVTIPQGAQVLINVADIHSNPDLWGPEPVDKLVPERFLSERKGERHSMAYLPFGAGPKNCIGMRFALMEAKMALINVLQRFTLLKCDKTQIPLKYSTAGVHGPAEGVFVRMQERV